jgi:alpha-mannosidase
MGRRTVAIVPHTHWDREWYSPFQTFRLRLVDLLDEFLPALEDDLSYARFLLDGQMAVVDDYLEVRPEAESTLRRLAATGRLAMGPWYTLPDEFLVSGETHIRNLQLGLEKATTYGGAMDVGYLPDMFGHIAQMPQLLSQFGFGHTVVWRGVPSAIDRTAFWWTAPDGTTIRAQYLARGGYGNGAAIPDDAKALLQRVAAHEHELGELLPKDAGMLFMNGTDHQVPQSWLGRVVAEANELQDDYHFVVTSLAEFLTDPAVATIDGLPSWTGELRSGARANLLMGVASNHVRTKQLAARAERALERLAEPLCAAFLPAEAWPASLLAIAWREVIRNAAHDSICACSHDEVVAAVDHRFNEARQIAEGLADRACRAVAATMANAGPVVLNPSARTRGGVVEVVVGTDEPVPGAQVLRSRPAGPTAARRMRPSDVASLLGQIRGQRFSQNFFVTRLVVDGDEVTVHLDTTPGPDGGAAVEEARRNLYAQLGSTPDGWYSVRMVRPPMQQLLVRMDDVPGYGWARWTAARTTSAAPVTVAASAEGGDVVVDNGLVELVVSGADGTFSLGGVAGLGRLVDDGEAGDTYNYCPPRTDTIVDEPSSVAITVVESGPVRATVSVDRTYSWPERLDDATGARVGAVEVVVNTLVELRAGEAFVRVTTAFDNRARDHRLRAWFPLRAAATSSFAECAFAVVERGLEAEGGPSESPMPTYPSRRFVSAGGVTVAHEGLLEYELVDGGGALALTLLRANGWLSRGPMATRPEPAGPVNPLEGPQVQGRVELRYAVAVGDGVDPYALVDDAFLPLPVVVAPGGGAPGAPLRPDEGQALSVIGAEVSALRRAPGGLELRVFNPSDEPTSVVVEGRRGWLVDLRGRPLEPFEGSFDLAPWRIATARLDD